MSTREEENPMSISLNRGDVISLTTGKVERYAAPITMIAGKPIKHPNR